MTTERKDNNYFFDSGNLSPAALERKHRIETDPSVRTDIMEYLPGMEVIHSDIRDKVLDAFESYDASKYTARDVQFALQHDTCSIEDFKALLSPAAAPFLEQMAAKGTEVILGCNRDAKFGPLVMFGMGGTTAELMKDVQFRLAPMSQYWIHSMLENTKVYKLMNNYRGLGQHDLAALEDALTRLSVMVAENPEIAELDINPLIVHAEGQGCSLADSRIVLKKVK